MGSTSTDYSSDYAPSMNQKNRVEVVSGIQSEDLAAIVSSLGRTFESSMDRNQKELRSLREERGGIRQDSIRMAMDNNSTGSQVRRNDQDFAARTHSDDLRAGTENRRVDYDLARQGLKTG